MAENTPKYIDHIDDKLNKDLSFTEKALPGVAALAHIGAGAAAGKYLGKKQLKSHKLKQYLKHLKSKLKNADEVTKRKINSTVSVVEKTPTVTGAIAGAIPGAAASGAIERKNYKNQGVEVSPLTGKITNMTDEAREKYAAENTNMSWKDKALYTAALGGGAALGYKFHKLRKSGLDNMADQAERSGFKFKTYEDIKNAAEELGLKFKEGKFYKPDGSEIKRKKDVKKAYKSKAMKHHPDRNPDDPNATEKVRNINKAFKETIQGDENFEKLSSLKEDNKKLKYTLLGILAGTAGDAGQAIARRKAVSGAGLPIGAIAGFSTGAYLDHKKKS